MLSHTSFIISVKHDKTKFKLVGLLVPSMPDSVLLMPASYLLAQFSKWKTKRTIF